MIKKIYGSTITKKDWDEGKVRLYLSKERSSGYPIHVWVLCKRANNKKNTLARGSKVVYDILKKFNFKNKNLSVQKRIDSFLFYMRTSAKYSHLEYPKELNSVSEWKRGYLQGFRDSADNKVHELLKVLKSL